MRKPLLIASMILAGCSPASMSELETDRRSAPETGPMTFESPDVTSVLAGQLSLAAGPGPSELRFRFASVRSSGGEWTGLLGSIAAEGAFEPQIDANGHLRVEYAPESDAQIIADNRGDLAVTASDGTETAYYFRSITLDVDPNGHATGRFVLVSADRLAPGSWVFADGHDVTIDVQGTMTGSCTRLSEQGPGYASVVTVDREHTNPICQRYEDFIR